MSSALAAVRAASGLLSKQRFGFPASNRLKRRADFQRLYTLGARVPGRYVVLFLKKTEEGAGRFGVTASRKIGGAVSRSKAKRRLRELYRLHREELQLCGVDIVANAKRGTISASWRELERDFVGCLGRWRDGAADERRSGRETRHG